MVREMSREIKAQKRAPQRIEIFVDQIEQLFNSMDPSPFQEKDLDHDAEEFIVSWAREYAHRDRFALVVHVNQSARIETPAWQPRLHHARGRKWKAEHVRPWPAGASLDGRKDRG